MARNWAVTLSSDEFSFSIKTKVELLIKPDCKTQINATKFIKRGHCSKYILNFWHRNYFSFNFSTLCT